MKEFWNDIWFNVKRVYPDIISLVSVFGLMFLLPTSTFESPDPKMGLISVFLAKLMFISAGILHAHITRKLMWPYIDFNDEKQSVMSKVLVVAWYSVIIWGWARGG
jgi:uncharacterized membrane protein